MVKQDLVSVWRNTEALCDSVFSECTHSSKLAQKVYVDDIVLPNSAKTYAKTTITVTDSDTISAAYLSASRGNKVAVLNFASATNPGGGTMRGSSAQEECICRCTNLLPCLYDSEDVFNKFYKYHRDIHDNRATDRCVYTPNVVIFKDCAYNRVEPKNINVITCAAPNLRSNPRNIYNSEAYEGGLLLDDSELYRIHSSRAAKIIKCAIVNNCNSIILGAFGCGAFKNNPEVVSRAWNEAVQKYKKYFNYIEFAIFCKSDTLNFDVFDHFIKEE